MVAKEYDILKEWGIRIPDKTGARSTGEVKVIKLKRDQQPREFKVFRPTIRPTMKQHVPQGSKRRLKKAGPDRSSMSRSDNVKALLNQQDPGPKNGKSLRKVNFKHVKDSTTRDDLHYVKSRTSGSQKEVARLAESLVALDPDVNLKGRTFSQPPWNHSFLKDYLHFESSDRPLPGYSGCVKHLVTPEHHDPPPQHCNDAPVSGYTGCVQHLHQEKPPPVPAPILNDKPVAGYSGCIKHISPRIEHRPQSPTMENNTDRPSDLDVCIDELRDFEAINSSYMSLTEANRLLMLRKRVERERQRLHEKDEWSKHLRLLAQEDADALRKERQKRERRMSELQKDQRQYEQSRRRAKEKRMQYLRKAHLRSPEQEATILSPRGRFPQEKAMRRPWENQAKYRKTVTETQRKLRDRYTESLRRQAQLKSQEEDATREYTQALQKRLMIHDKQ